MKYIKSPLNYTGGKFKILNSILPLLPYSINTFIDLFGGGFNVGINVNAEKIIYNDHNPFLKDMFLYFKENDLIIDEIKKTISEFKLSKTNKEGYLKLRERYNKDKSVSDLFVLTCYSFNHQIRFNSKHEFNTPFGKERSEYNNTIETNLKEFIKLLKSKNIEFCSGDFMSFKDYQFKKNDFVYCDPPYLITNASYNDGKRGFKDWGEKEEEELLSLLDDFDKRKINFMLSNVLEHQGRKNERLIEWSKNYNIKEIEKDYKNCNYHKKSKAADTQEVIIYNFKNNMLKLK